MTRLKEKYLKEVVPALTKEFGYKNVMAVPRIEKVVVNMGLGEATSNAKLVDVGADELARITGQKPAAREPLVPGKEERGASVRTFSQATRSTRKRYERRSLLINSDLLAVSVPSRLPFRWLAHNAKLGPMAQEEIPEREPAPVRKVIQISTIIHPERDSPFIFAVWPATARARGTRQRLNKCICPLA